MLYTNFRTIILNKIPQDSRLKISLLKNRIKQKIYIHRQLEKWFKKQWADYFIISFPKCGRTWLRLMIGKAVELKYGLKDVDILELDQLSKYHSDIPKMLVLHDDSPFWKKPHELNEKKDKYKNKNVIFLVRDPRDVIVSSYFQKKNRWKRYTKELSSYVYENRGGIDTIIKYYNIWRLNKSTPKKFLLIRYEDMHKNPYAELRKVLNFLKLKSIPDEIVRKSVKHASFNNMKKMEKDDIFTTGKMKSTNIDDDESFKVRKGKAGGYLDYLNKDEIEFLNSKIKNKLHNIYGY